MRTRIWSSLLTAAVFVAVLPHQASAQADEVRSQGLFVALSIGSGYVDYGGLAGEPLDRESGLGGILPRIGYRFNSHFAVALQGHAWSRFGAETTYGGIQGVVLMTPNPSRALRFAVGLGPERVSDNIGGSEFRDYGVGVSAYVMYDWRFGRTVALSPYVSLNRGWLDRDDVLLVSTGLGLVLW